MKKAIFMAALLTCFNAFSLPAGVVEEKQASATVNPVVLQKFSERAKQNKNWKSSIKLGDHEQVIYMNVSTSTTPDNEIGSSKSSYDQLILVAQGTALISLNGNASTVKSGDIVFIPQGTVYGIKNKSRISKLKLASFCSRVSSPTDVAYKSKIDEKAN